MSAAEGPGSHAAGRSRPIFLRFLFWYFGTAVFFGVILGCWQYFTGI